MSAQVGIRDAKMNLSKYLKLVKEGQEVILTERGHPIGKIVPIKKTELSLKDRIRRLEESGILEPEKKLSGISPPIPINGKSAQEYLQEDRNA
jgi:prevent-host-death family protein